VENLIQFGIRLAQAMQTMSPGLDTFMRATSFFGTIEFYLLLVPLLYWLVDSRLGIRVLLVLLSADILGTYTKQLFHQPRPYWVGDVQPLSTEPSYGIPSTHASDSLAVWGYLGMRLQKKWAWTVAVILILLIGISRLYLGVHFPHDVIFGWIIGAVAIFIFLKLEDRAIKFLQSQTIGHQMSTVFGLSILFYW